MVSFSQDVKSLSYQGGSAPVFAGRKATKSQPDGLGSTAQMVERNDARRHLLFSRFNTNTNTNTPMMQQLRSKWILMLIFLSQVSISTRVKKGDTVYKRWPQNTKLQRYLQKLMRKQYFVRHTVTGIYKQKKMEWHWNSDNEQEEQDRSSTTYYIRYFIDCDLCQGTVFLEPTEVYDAVDMDGFSLDIAKLITTYLPPKCDECRGSGRTKEQNTLKRYVWQDDSTLGPAWMCRGINSQGVILGTYHTVFEKELRKLYRVEQEVSKELTKLDADIEECRADTEKAMRTARGTHFEHLKRLEDLIGQKQALEDDLAVKRTIAIQRLEGLLRRTHVKFNVSDEVEGLWYDAWYPAIILEVTGNDTYKIRWTEENTKSGGYKTSILPNYELRRRVKKAEGKKVNHPTELGENRLCPTEKS